jgi:OmpA-OmpF porin, OOP family
VLLERKSKTRAAESALGVAVALSLLTGCSGGGGSSSAQVAVQTLPRFCMASGPVVLAVSGREDSPAPALTPCMEAAVTTAAGDGSAVSVVDVDGTPKMTNTGALDTSDLNGGAKPQYEDNFEAQVAQTVQAVRATSPHADVLDALNVAGRLIHASSSLGGTIFLEDSGLQDIQPLNFTRPGQLEALPARVVSFLSAEGELPSLAGVTVVLVGIGDTAPPQQPLGIGLQNHLRAIWSAIITAGGGRVETDSYPRQNPAPDRVPSVELVQVPPLPKWPGQGYSVRLPDTGPVGFEPNTATFRDPSAAQDALAAIAGYLLDNPTVKVELTGTTAHFDGNQWDQTLSMRRANAVKSMLVALGVSAGQVVTHGDGWESPCYQNDGGPSGPMISAAAEHNRSVIVTMLPHAVSCS